jgi:hypothetical protein
LSLLNGKNALIRTDGNLTLKLPVNIEVFCRSLENAASVLVCLRIPITGRFEFERAGARGRFEEIRQRNSSSTTWAGSRPSRTT